MQNLGPKVLVTRSETILGKIVKNFKSLFLRKINSSFNLVAYKIFNPICNQVPSAKAMWSGLKSKNQPLQKLRIRL